MKKSKSTCSCGCGARTNLGSKGQARRYLRGHNRNGTGKGWKEGGYRYVSRGGQKIALHRLIVEDREGRSLGSDELVHHVDHNRLNNSPENLVIISRSEHQRLHSAG